MFLKLFICSLLAVGTLAATAANKKSAKQTKPAATAVPVASPAAAPAPAPAPAEPAATIDWGKCPQLAPTEADKAAKGRILEECLKEHPVPGNLTEQSIDKHQRQMAECALKKEKWFSKSGAYRYSKAETEIKAKKLIRAVESQLVAHHKKCAEEAKGQFGQKDQVIEQVQLYQACMDFHITQTCQIQLTPPSPPIQPPSQPTPPSQ